ncbi:hypothetical protein IW261DRAFT_1671886 [Armillaria novae-zelandiae]|uniref:Uncharacterized protein n=1 Tax=Armillaria novae-zelandiae TaxID=153914 RepID=A0AA39T851_9AGAR|nr:hypothetical protein IW261DRAFT_1671886 [Armillaria novae-zelandiae]
MGIYTGIVVVTLWNICKESVVYYFTQAKSSDTVVTSKSQHIGRVMIIIIILLHGLTVANFAVYWSEIHSRYVNHGQSSWTKYSWTSDPMMIFGEGIMAVICTILAESTIIWRCWIVWGQRWLIILPPILLLISATVLRMLGTYQLYVASGDYIRYFTPYSSCVLATTLWCTLLIIYRIVTVARAGGGAGDGLRAYHPVLEVLVESSALYLISLILCTAFFARNADSLIYFDAFAAIARGIAPTLIVGRVAAGHARSADSWQGSVISHPLRFRSHVGGQSSPSNLDDLEAQRGGGGGCVRIALADSQEGTGGDGIRTLTGTQEDIIIDLEGFVREDHTEIDAGNPADGPFLE